LIAATIDRITIFVYVPAQRFKGMFSLKLPEGWLFSKLEINEQKINGGSKKSSRFLSTGHRILPSCSSKARETMVAKYELVL